LAQSAPTEKRADGKNQKLVDVSKQYEADFLRMMLKEMRKTVDKSDFMPDNMTESYFKEEMDEQYINNWTDQGGVGIADIIYQQVNDRYLNPVRDRARKPGEALPLPQAADKKPLPLFSDTDGKKFLVKKENQGFSFLAPQGIDKPVSVGAVLAGTIMSQARLEDGRQTLVVKHDDGLMSHLVYSGVSHVKNGDRVKPGQPIVDLAKSTTGAPVRMFFGLRSSPKPE
jgi:Rod binding domain-containing protein